jgi:hypothetical protein
MAAYSPRLSLRTATAKRSCATYAHQYNDSIRVVAFNTREGWALDVSYEFAVEIQRRADLAGDELTGNLAEFVECYTRSARQLSLRLA